MDLLTLIFGIVLLPAAFPLKCYKCLPESSGTCEGVPKECPSRAYECGALRITSYAGDSKLSTIHMKTCIMDGECVEESSINFGISRTVITSSCCFAELCNNRTAREPSDPTENGVKCYHCDGLKCTATLKCMGNEDHCFTKTVTEGSEKKISKGCVSRLECSNLANPQIRSVIGGHISCCEGSFCNNASSASVGLLLLVALLVSSAVFS